LNCFLV